MAIVASYDWESDTWIHNGDNPARAVWRQAVSEVATRAKAALPAEVNDCIEKAVQIVLNGDVTLLESGEARVASQSSGETVYHVCNGTCECRDFPKVVDGWCKHRLSAAIYKRASALAKHRLAQLDSASNGTSQPPTAQPQVQPQCEAPVLPEAPVSANCHILIEGRQVQVTLRDTDETRLLTRLAALLRQYPLAQPPT